MAEVVAKTGVKKEKGWLYFLDKNGNVSRALMSRAGRTKGKRNRNSERLRLRAAVFYETVLCLHAAHEEMKSV